MDVDALMPFCTCDAQRELLLCIRSSKTIREGIKKAGLGERNGRRKLAVIRKNAAKQGYSPDHDMTKPVPDGFVVSGVSTYYNEEGTPTGQWVKSKLAESDRLQALQEAIKDFVEDYRGKAKPVSPPKAGSDDIMVTIPIGDPHIGMYAWAEEAGENFNVQIARDDLLSAMTHVIKSAPSAHKCAIINLGDFFHADNMDARTSRSGHSLDVDSRWAHVLKLGCMLMVDAINLALKRHQEVEVINAIGNHDDHSSVMLAAFLDAYFHEEPRVTVQPTVSKYNYLRFGKCLIGVTHGDTVKHAALGELMATDRAEDWGETEFRYWYVGHIHHTQKLELRGCMVESFRTLAARDAWHSSKGYRAGRDLNSIVIHKEFGEIARFRCDIRMARYG